MKHDFTLVDRINSVQILIHDFHICKSAAWRKIYLIVLERQLIKNQDISIIILG